MKKILFKLFSILMCLVLVFTSVFCVQSFAQDDFCGTDFPVIYISGQGKNIVRVNESGETERLYPINIPVNDYLEVAKNNIDVLAKALVTQEWTEFGNLIRDTMLPLFGKLALGKDGKPTDGSYCETEHCNMHIDTTTVNGKYGAEQFMFQYDWRLDPYDIADELHDYIELVLKETHSDHVGIASRCLGCCIATAYMEKYDGEHVTDFVLYASALNGVKRCSKLFAGDLFLESGAVERYVYDSSITPNEVYDELIKAFVSVFKSVYGIDLACWAFNNVWQDIYIDILPQILIETFGTFPGYWSMVSDEDYIRAKKNVFHNQDMTEWAKLIKKIDNYHYNVQVKAPEFFKKFTEKGITVSNITKYGFQTVPLFDPPDLLADGVCSVYDASMGATASGINSVLSDEYISSSSSRYISPDRQIDASTCLFPERTWFIKNILHNDFPAEINPLICAIINNHDMTVDTNENFPQYMVYSDNKLIPMTKENSQTDKYKHSLFDALLTIFKNLFAILKNSIISH